MIVAIPTLCWSTLLWREKEREISLPSETPLPLIEFYLLINAHGESVREDVDSLCISAPFSFLLSPSKSRIFPHVWKKNRRRSDKTNKRIGYSIRERKDRRLDTDSINSVKLD